MEPSPGSDRAGNNVESSLPSLSELTMPPREADGWWRLVEASKLGADWKSVLEESFTSAMKGHREYEAIRPLLREARELNAKELRKVGIESDESTLHGSEEIDLQSYAVMLGARAPHERITLGLVAHATHMIDDPIDRADEDGRTLRAHFHQHRFRLKEFLEEWPVYGAYASSVADYAPSKTGYYFGLRRMLYGGLIVQAETPERLESYLSEYQKLCCEGLGPELRDAVCGLSKLALSATAKTICEAFPLSGGETREQSQLRAICFAPAILLSDLRSEIEHREVPAFGVPPTVDDLTAMIDCAIRFRDRFNEAQAVRFREQVNLVRKALAPVLPEAIALAYERCAEGLRERRQ